MPDTPATPETQYYVGSTTKAQVAATLAHLIDSKAYPKLSLGWKTPIASIIPDDFVIQDEWATKHLTLEDAVTHRTGMPRYDHSWHRERNGSAVTLKDMVRNLRNLPGLKVEPRTEWHYCNMMYLVLSHVIETVTGKGLEEVMKETIWEPLGMGKTYLERKSDDGLAKSYVWREEKGEFERMPYFEGEVAGGAGGVVSNVVDYAKWLNCLINEEKPFSKDAHKDIRTPRIIQRAKPDGFSDVDLYGLGWWRQVIHGEVAYKHAGSTSSYGAETFWFPELKYGLVAFANGEAVSNYAEIIILRRLIQDKLGVPEEKRLDIEKILKDMVKKSAEDVENAEELLYPKEERGDKKPSVGVEELVGDYENAGFGRLRLVKKEVDGEEMLVANRGEMLFAYEVRMKWVVGDEWIVYHVPGNGLRSGMEFYKGRFVVEGGRVKELVVEYSDRFSDLADGSVSYARV